MAIKILVLDGGGAKGIMQMVALMILEQVTGKKICELFDLIVGTSVGSINAAMLSMGTHTAEQLVEIMKETMPKVFKRTTIFKKFKYSKAPLKKKFNELWGAETTMACAKTKLIVTTYEDTVGREHFYKSWELEDGMIPLFDAVDRSSAAPLYFGQVVDNHNFKVYLDGGVGEFNNPTEYAYIEAKRQGWLDKEVHCYSVGCGQQDFSRTFKESAGAGVIDGVKNFISLKTGGLAKRNAPENAARFGYAMEDGCWSYDRVECILKPSKLDAMDKIKYTNKYIEYGEELGHELVDAFLGRNDG